MENVTPSRRIVYASDCAACECCGEPVCPYCEEHYADCPCPGPHSEQYEDVEARYEALRDAHYEQQGDVLRDEGRRR
jgi:proteasome lid subunit RPN8/RPN11